MDLSGIELWVYSAGNVRSLLYFFIAITALSIVTWSGSTC